MKNESVKLLTRAGARYLVTIFLLLGFFTLSSNAQDLLKLKSGRELKVIIVEESTGVVKYREYENQSGPVFSIGMDKVESIKYKKGKRNDQVAKDSEQVKDTVSKAASVVNPVGPPQLTAKKRVIYLDGVAQSPRSIRLLMEDQPEALKMYESGKRMYTASNACPFLAMIITFPAAFKINDMTEQSDKLRVGIPVLCIDAGLVIAGIIFGSKGKANLQKSVSLYNSAVSKPVQSSLVIGLQENGVGVSLKF